MEAKPLVSIGIPAYKTTFLERAINSALSQTYEKIELVIVNDRSPHDVTSIVKKFKDKRIRYFVNEKNVGASDPGCNWNECLARARGDYFCLLCDDDAYEPMFMEELLSLTEKYPDCNVFHSSVKVVNMRNEVIQRFPKSPEWESCADYIINKARRLRKQTISEWMYKTSHIRSLGGYDNLPLAWGSDYLSVMKFSQKGGIATTQKELAVFRRSDENITMQRQGHCETKIYALSLYKNGMMALVNNNDELRSSVTKSHIDKIKNYEDVAVLMGATWDEYRAIVRRRREYQIAASSIAIAFVKRIIKRLMGR